KLPNIARSQQLLDAVARIPARAPSNFAIRTLRKLGAICLGYASFFMEAMFWAHRRRHSTVADKSWKRPRYSIPTLAEDGWADRACFLLTHGSGVVELAIEVPGWLPFNYPWRLRANLDGEQVAKLEVGEPGYYSILIPAVEGGKIELRADQWLVPSALG